MNPIEIVGVTQDFATGDYRLGTLHTTVQTTPEADDLTLDMLFRLMELADATRDSVITNNLNIRNHAVSLIYVDTNGDYAYYDESLDVCSRAMLEKAGELARGETPAVYRDGSVLLVSTAKRVEIYLTAFEWTGTKPQTPTDITSVPESAVDVLLRVARRTVEYRFDAVEPEYAEGVWDAVVQPLAAALCETYGRAAVLEPLVEELVENDEDEAVLELVRYIKED